MKEDILNFIFSIVCLLILIIILSIRISHIMDNENTLTIFKGKDYELKALDNNKNNSNKINITLKDSEKYNIILDEETKKITIEFIK